MPSMGGGRRRVQSVPAQGPWCPRYDGRVPTPPIELLGAVQDLFALYTRHGPRGPYRHSLFGEQAEAAAEWPTPVRQHAAALDVLIRGVSCLLANELAAAAPPLLGSLWRSVRRLARRLSTGAQREPAYYRFLTSEIGSLDASGPGDVYRLFGEVLAVYLDLLLASRPELRQDHGGQVARLRRLLAQTGVKSSAAASGSSAGSSAD